MPKIVYYVACSLDGFIAGVDDDVSQFSPSGPGVEKYLSDVQIFATVIMGRRTYEFGYQYGLAPGQPAYPHMEHHVFSDSIRIDELAPSVHIEPVSIDRVREIKASSPTDVYLCGGGEFAGWLLEHDMIDQLKLKLNPIVIGEGVRLFGASTKKAAWHLVDNEVYDNGVIIATYDLRRGE